MTCATAEHRSLLPGVGVTAGAAGLATVLGAHLPLVGAPVLGILLGLAIAALVPRSARLEPGASFSGSVLLRASIVVLGTGAPLAQVFAVGVSSLPVMLGTLATALAGAWLVGAALGVNRETRVLIGVRTGICGAAAIAAATAVIRPDRARVAQAIGTIFAFNIVAVLVFPGLGHLLGLSQEAFALWAGTAVNDTSSVVAAAYAFGPEAGERAVVVKLTRALMIVPICLALSGLPARRRGAVDTERGGGAGLLRAMPLFIVGFVVASLLRSLGAIPEAWLPALSGAGQFLVAMALAGIGLTIRPSAIRRAGWAPLGLGAILFVLVGASSLALQWATGTL